MNRPAVFAVTGVLCALPALGDHFTQARYRAAPDELVVGMAYRGTNPDHEFTLQWGKCKSDGDEQTVSADVLDSQPRDPARQDFTKTVHFDLHDMPCRPARVALRTAPRYVLEVRIPAVP